MPQGAAAAAPDEDPTASLVLEFECGEMELPLCHEGICTSSKQINVFIKRLKATKSNSAANDQPRQAIWMLAGGPGGSSSAMENLMHSLYHELDERADIYTMDHRGTGRSFFLRCDAAQAFSDGSPMGEEISFEELPSCINDLLFKIEGHTEAFSVTSAATDLVQAIEFFHGASGTRATSDDKQQEEEEEDATDDDDEVFVYGVSYGSFLVERLVHLAPVQVKGYILDGVESESGRDFIEKSSFCRPNENANAVTAQLLEYCAQDTLCFDKMTNALAGFQPDGQTINDGNDLVEAMQVFYKRWDADEIATDCVIQLSMLNSPQQFPKDSHVLKAVLNYMLLERTLRGLIPAMLYRFLRCDQATKGDLDFVSQIIMLLFAPPGMHSPNGQQARQDKDPDHHHQHVRHRHDDPHHHQMFSHASAPEERVSTMLYNLIVFSEMWEVPTPPAQQFLDSLDQGIVGSTDGHLEVAQYCLLTGNGKKNAHDAAICDQLDLPESKPFYYQVDAFWNHTAVIPDDASVLLLSGKLDPLTPDRYAQQQFKNYQGDAILVQFDHAGHGATWETVMHNSDLTCGIEIIVSYVKHHGDIDAVDTSCLQDLEPLAFDLAPRLAMLEFGVDDVFEGVPVMQPWWNHKQAKERLHELVKSSTGQTLWRKRMRLFG